MRSISRAAADAELTCRMVHDRDPGRSQAPERVVTERDHADARGSLPELAQAL